MRDIILIGFPMLLLLGCDRSPNLREDALRVWRSPDASLEQRAEAVMNLIPKGATREEIFRLLGTNCVLSHFHGPTIDGTTVPPRSAPAHDYWLLRCQFPGGGVDLRLDPPTPEGGFVSAAPFRMLRRIPYTNTP